MTDIYLTYDEIRKLRLLTPNSKGHYGSVYKYKDGCVKIFHQNLVSTDIYKIERNIRKKSNIIIYPKCKVRTKEEGVVRGYFMDVAIGVDFSTLIKNKFTENDLSFEYLLHIFYDKFIKDLKHVDLMIDDMKPDHIFIDDNLCLVDTDFFYDSSEEFYRSQIGGNSPFKDVYSYNIDVIKETFLSIFFQCSYPSCYDLIYSIQFDTTSENYLLELVNQIKNKTNGEVKTFGQLCRYKK